ncbi:MAG: hypothetical protein SGJ09_03475 [Phycisphaerae bacterium]|nr:hypothetical protein [Phycisphaerae bacterium]
MAAQLQNLAMLVWQQTALTFGFNLVTAAMLAVAFRVARQPLPITSFSLFAI